MRAVFVLLFEVKVVFQGFGSDNRSGCFNQIAGLAASEEYCSGPGFAEPGMLSSGCPF